LNAPSFALLTACNPDATASDPAALASLRRAFQTTWRLPTPIEADWKRFVAAAAEPAQNQPRELENVSGLDPRLSDQELQLLANLGALAGPAPRNVVRLINLYRLARHDAPQDAPELALMLALILGGSEADRNFVLRALAQGDESALAKPEETVSPRLRAALASFAQQAGPLEIAPLRRVAALARQWTF
jgi:hypothetical protein